jgi:hypothetical protein
MATELRPDPPAAYHACALPWPADPEIPEGHVCECGRRWVYQPAHWDPLLTLTQLCLRQEAGDFLRGIIPQFRPKPAVGEPGVIVHVDRERWNEDTT